MVLRWGRLSDRIGRKPVILCGLLGLTLSSMCFGISKTYGGLVVSRALAGLLSGNIGVMKSAIGEITDETNIAEGAFRPPDDHRVISYSLISRLCPPSCGMVRRRYHRASSERLALCSILTSLPQGPLMGGFLSRPHDKWPRLFGAEFWQTYPYFLPCAAAAFVSLISFSVVALFFEEVRETQSGGFTMLTNDALAPDQSLPELRRSKIIDDKEYQPLPSSKHVSLKRITHQRTSSEETLVELPIRKVQPSIRDIATRSVIVAVANYCALALLDIAFCALLPLFCATSIADGGLGLSPSQIGLILGALVCNAS